MVIAAEAGGFGELISARASWGMLAIGAGLVLCAVAVDGLSGVGFRWGVDLADEISERGGRGEWRGDFLHPVWIRVLQRIHVRYSDKREFIDEGGL